jgi:8-oxo-dGTP diphosphatase
MQRLLTIRESDIYPERENLNPDSFRTRNAARAIVLNSKGGIALLNATTHNYHKLPGGGIELGENVSSALQRELLEEIGCKADITSEVGEVVEYRDEWKLMQISHCYLAKQTGKQQAPSFTQSEIDEGFEIVWADNIKTAIKLLEQDKPKNYDGLFIQRRDIQLLKTAQRILTN